MKRKKCPFCNSSLLGAGWGENKFDGEFCVIHCRNCRATGPKGETEEEAWKLWNIRKFKTIEPNKGNKK